MSSISIYSQQLDSFLASIRYQADWIRFPEYRCALKLYLISKKINLHLITLFDVLEAIREHGLQSSYSQHHNHYIDDPFNAYMRRDKLEDFIRNILTLVNKRLPLAQSITNSIDRSIGMLITILSRAFGPTEEGIRVIAVKITLALLCKAKLVDKLRYLFTLFCDDLNGMLVMSRFNAFLSDSIKLTHVVSETSAYRFSPQLVHAIFDFSRPVMLADFIELFLGAAGPPDCLAWIGVFDRLSITEFLVHQTNCDACGRNNFIGLRYKCQRCFRVILCQDCFWRGRVTGQHNPDTHPCKEYSYWKGPTSQLSHSLRKSFRCVPGSRKTITVQEEPPLHRRVNLANLVPPSPIPSVRSSRTVVSGLTRHESLSAPNTPYTSMRSKSSSRGILKNQNQQQPLINVTNPESFNPHQPSNSFVQPQPQLSTSMITGGGPPPLIDNNISMSRSVRIEDDQEHILIREVAEKLRMADSIAPNVHAHHHHQSSSSSGDRAVPAAESRMGRIAELEAKNREIMRAIRMEIQDDVLNPPPLPPNHNLIISSPAGCLMSPMSPNGSDIVGELGLLSAHNQELETHLVRLQENREHLVSELETLMGALQSGGGGNFVMPPPESEIAPITSELYNTRM